MEIKVAENSLQNFLHSNVKSTAAAALNMVVKVVFVV